MLDIERWVLGHTKKYHSLADDLNEQLRLLHIGDYFVIKISDTESSSGPYRIEVGKISQIDPATSYNLIAKITIELITSPGTVTRSIYMHEKYGMFSQHASLHASDKLLNIDLQDSCSFEKVDKLGLKEALEERIRMHEEREQFFKEIQKRNEAMQNEREIASRSITDREIEELLKKQKEYR